MQLKANYHSHTARCWHATGEDEEYVQAGIRAGISIFGFSDHVILPDKTQPRMRGAPYMLPDYLDSVARLKEKYKDQIEIHTGFECEWYGRRYESYYRDLLESGKVEYLILGQHCFLRDDQFCWYGNQVDADQALDDYCDAVIEGMESGLFLYVCHPDFFMLWYPSWNSHTREVSRRIARKAKELGIPLEVNMGPKSRSPELDLNDERIAHYPYPLFWDIVAEEGPDCVIGVDAHLPTIYDEVSDAPFHDFIKKHHLHRLETLSLTKKSEK